MSLTYNIPLVLAFALLAGGAGYLAYRLYRKP